MRQSLRILQLSSVEIDQEILQDLVKDATTIRFWSRMPAKFLNPIT